MLAYVGSNRILYPLVMLQCYMFHKALKIGSEHLPEYKREEFFHYATWASNLQTDIETGIADISALLVQNLPTQLASLQEMLRTAMVESGSCCTEAIIQYVRATADYQDDRLAKGIPEFNPEWLTVQGVKDNYELLSG